MATILLVDDAPKILRPLQLLVEFEGYRVLTAQDGEAALGTTGPNLIVTDWMMPNVDGSELCRRLKSNTVMADIPVVMLSAALPPRQTERLWDVLLLKPTPIERLLTVIDTLLGNAAPEGYGVTRQTRKASRSDFTFPACSAVCDDLSLKSLSSGDDHELLGGKRAFR